VVVTAEPLGSARIGDHGTVGVSAGLDDGPVTTTRTVVHVGVGVDLAAVGSGALRAAPGRDAAFAPQVTNAGRVAVTGIGMLFTTMNQRLLRPQSHRNCRYADAVVACFFSDVTLAPGGRYAVSRPIVVRAPADSIPSSRSVLMPLCLTAAEWED
jgi:hypothetical protein